MQPVCKSRSAWVQNPFCYMLKNPDLKRSIWLKGWGRMIGLSKLLSPKAANVSPELPMSSGIRLFVLRWDLANNISDHKSSFYSKLFICSLSKEENVQVAWGWDFSFSDVSCEREELCFFFFFFHLASREDFWVLKAQGLRETAE